MVKYKTRATLEKEIGDLQGEIVDLTEKIAKVKLEKVPVVDNTAVEKIEAFKKRVELLDSTAMYSGHEVKLLVLTNL